MDLHVVLVRHQPPKQLPSSPTTTTTKISDRALCVSATTRTGLTGELEWDNRFSHHKDEAKRRGLTCGVVGSPETMQTQKTVEDCAEWGCYKDWEVCRKASFVKVSCLLLWNGVSNQTQLPKPKEAV